MPKKKKGKKKEKKEAAPPPPPPPPRVPVWPHGAVPDWQRVEGDVGAAVPEWQQLPAVVSTPPPDAKLCYDRFRISPTNQGPRLVDSLSTTTSELSGRKELRSVVESAYNAIAALSTASIKERLARQGKMSQVSAPELRARLGALAAASALVRIARAEGVGEDQIREARVGDTDGDGVDTETLEALTTLIVTERANRQVAAANAAKAATEGSFQAMLAPYVSSALLCRRLSSRGESCVCRNSRSGWKCLLPPHFGHPKPLIFQCISDTQGRADIEADSATAQPVALRLS